MSPTYGVAAEIKKQISNDESQWVPHVVQLRKYDDALTGWWTSDERIEHSDALMLLEISRGRAFTRFLERIRAEKGDSAVGAHSAVIEFNRADEGRPYVFFRLAWGSICNAGLARKLDEGTKIPLEKAFLSFPAIRFYDARPPVEQLMNYLWIDSFLSRMAASEADPTSGVVPLIVAVSELTDELQKAFGSQAKGLTRDHRSPEFPKSTWVREALDLFVDLDLADDHGDGETYTIKYKTMPRKDVLESFCRLVAAKQKPTSDVGQLGLFGT